MESFQEQFKSYHENLEWHLAAHIRNEAPLLHWMMALKPKRVIEVGAGTGKGAVIVKRLLPHAVVYATDINPVVCEGIRKVVEMGSVSVIVEVTSVLHLPYCNSSFDVCYSTGLMEHFSVEDMIKGVKEQLRISRYVIVEVPTLIWFLENRSAQGGELQLPKMEWLRLLRDLGYILDFYLVGAPLEEIIISVLMTLDKTAMVPLAPDKFICLQ